MRWPSLLCTLLLLVGFHHAAAASRKVVDHDRPHTRYQKVASALPGEVRQAIEEMRSEMRSGLHLGSRPSGPSLEKTGGLAPTMQKFPYQLDDFNYFTNAPVALANGEVLFLWSTADTLFGTLSNDNAQTWGARGEIGFASSYIYEVTAIQKADGTILVMMEVDTGVDWVSSPDNGASWSSPSHLAGTTGLEFEPSLTEATDGTLLLTYYTPGTASTDIAFRSSTDGGGTWGSEAFVSTGSNMEFAPTIVSGDGTTLLALYMSFSGNDFDIVKRTSTNGGAAWSAEMPVLNSSLGEYRPRVVRQSNGTLHHVFFMDQPSPTFPDILPGELHSATSTDGGVTWSPPARFTQFVGNDGNMNVTLLNNQPLVTFRSSRYVGEDDSQVWYGLIGTTVDSDVPPVAYAFLGTNGVIKSNAPSYLTGGADDDTGVSSVSVQLEINGVGSAPIPMFDDGAHGDGTAGDGIWGAEILGLQALDTLVYAMSVTDLDNNTWTGNLEFGNAALALPAHETGALTLAVQPRGHLGAFNPVTGFPSGFNANYGAFDYLFAGGLWVGSRVGQFLQKRVSSTYDPFDDGDWRPSQGSAITAGPGVSDEDITMTYDDGGAPLTLGLRVEQTSYHWTGASRNEFLIIDHSITNTGHYPNLSEVYASFYFDADVAAQTNPFDDLAGYDATRGLLYMYDSQMNPGGYIGMRWLDGALPAVVNVHTGDLNNDALQFDAMTTDAPPTGTPDDYRILITAPAFSLDSGATKTVAFGLVVGQDLASLQANADTMKAIYDGAVTSVDGEGVEELPREYALDQNYPNPFNPSTVIRYHLPQASVVRVELFNGVGQLVRLLVDGEQAAGIHTVRLDATELPSGVYFYRLLAGQFTATKKLMLLK